MFLTEKICVYIFTHILMEKSKGQKNGYRMLLFNLRKRAGMNRHLFTYILEKQWENKQKLFLKKVT